MHFDLGACICVIDLTRAEGIQGQFMIYVHCSHSHMHIFNDYVPQAAA